MLCPNNKQKTKLFQYANTARFAYNWALEKEQENHKNGGKFISDGDLRKEFTKLKKTDKYAWLKDIVVKQYDNNPEAYFDEVYENSLLSNPAKAEKILKNFKAKQIKKLENDPAIELFANIWTQYAEKDRFTLAALDTKLDSLYRVYVDGIMKKDNKKEFYPDANLTLRVAYGNITCKAR